MQGRSAQEMAAWVADLRAHRNHEGFRTESNAWERSLGFSCSSCCENTEGGWFMDLTSYRHLLAEVRADFEVLRQHTHGVDEARWGIACDRAEKILRDVLSPEEREQLEATNSFTVHGADGHVYVIERSPAMNVVLHIEGIAVARYCVTSQSKIPTADLMLAHKLMLEADPVTFFTLANRQLCTTNKSLRDRAPAVGGIETG